METLSPAVPLQFLKTGRNGSNVLEYQLPVNGRYVDWSDDGLVIGHDLGILDLVKKNNNYPSFECLYQHLGLSVDIVCSFGPYYAAAHPDFSVTFVSSRPSEGLKIVRYEGSRSHDSFVNALDISPEGILASTGDDRAVLIHDRDDSTKCFPLSQTGQALKFRTNQQSNQLLVLESGNKIRVLDWTKGQWLVTVFVDPSAGPIRQLGVFDSSLLAVGAGWWKSYQMETLAGGCGFTQSEGSGSLLGAANAVTGDGNNEKYRTVVSEDGRYIANVSLQAVDIHDLHTSGGYGRDINYSLPGHITSASVGPGGVVAVVSGNSLILISPKPFVFGS